MPTHISASPFRPRGQLGQWARFMLQALRKARIWLRSKGKATWGEAVVFGPNADIRPTRFLRIGQRVAFAKNFTCEADATLGNDILVSSNVSLVGNDHLFNDPAHTVYTQGRAAPAAITIGNDVMLGFGVTVIAPASIGDGCIIGAGAVVTKDLAPYGVYGGVPARLIRPRFPAKKA